MTPEEIRHKEKMGALRTISITLLMIQLSLGAIMLLELLR